MNKKKIRKKGDSTQSTIVVVTSKKIKHRTVFHVIVSFYKDLPVITARCYAELCIATVSRSPVCPSVCPSVTLWYRGHMLHVEFFKNYFMVEKPRLSSLYTDPK